MAHQPGDPRRRRTRGPRAPARAATQRPALADGHHPDRAELDPHPRLSRGRADGPAVVRRGRLPDPPRRAADAVDRPAVRRGPGLVDRSRRDAALDAGGAQRRDDGRADRSVGRGRRPRVRRLSRRRHRDRACGSSTSGLARVRDGASDSATSRGSWCREPWHGEAPARASAIASTRAIRGRRGCCRWRTNSSWTASTSGCCGRSSACIEGRPDADEQPLPLNVNGAIAAVCGDLGFPPELGQRALHHRARAGPDRPRARGTAAPEADAADRPAGPRLRRPAGAPAAGDEEVGRAPGRRLCRAAGRCPDARCFG